MYFIEIIYDKIKIYQLYLFLDQYFCKYYSKPRFQDLTVFASVKIV